MFPGPWTGGAGCGSGELRAVSDSSFEKSCPCQSFWYALPVVATGVKTMFPTRIPVHFGVKICLFSIQKRRF